MKNIFNNRKMKYGSVAVVFTVIFIAIVILLNAIISALDSRYGFYIDMTEEQRYDIGETTISLLSGMEDKIEIIFLRDRDKLIENSSMSMMVTLAEKYESSFDNITVRYIDRSRNPGEVNKFRQNTTTKFYDSDVIVTAADTGRYRHLRQNAFFTLGEDGSSIYGFNGEMRFTASILAVTRASSDKVAIITGHDEVLSTPLLEVLMNAGYDTDESLVSVNLATDNIPEGTKLVVINNPQRDFSGYTAEKNGSVNEIAKIDRYLKEFGNLIVFIDNETGDLPELSEYLSQEWGISYTSGLVIEDDAAYSISTDGRSLIAQYNTDSENHPYAYEVSRRVATTSARTIMSSSTPLTLVETGDKTVSPILTTSPHARVLDDDSVTATGTQNIMAISSFMTYPDGQYEKYSHVIVSGSTDCVFTDMSGSTANADLIYSILSVIGTEKVPIDIPTKPFSDTSINTIGTATARNTTVTLSLIPAGIALAIGIAVYIKRRSL